MHRLLFTLPPEVAHRAAIIALKTGLVPAPSVQQDPILAQDLWGLYFANPLSNAAGFDKDAEVIQPLFKLGMGWVEVGTVTPQPQSGNPKPRVFRAIAQQALINRMGFPGGGMAAVLPRLQRAYAQKNRGVLAVNIGKNKATEDAASDYTAGIRALAPYADMIVINISSPNTPGLRALQQGDVLRDLIMQCQQAITAARKPLLVKIAPDLTDEQLADIVAVALDTKLDGLVVHNTALYRTEGLPSAFAAEAGGLSGAPITQRANAMMKEVYRATRGAIHLVGVGGIMNGDDAYQRILFGASLLQTYTGFVYNGPALIKDVVETLASRLRADGFANIQDAVGRAT